MSYINLAGKTALVTGSTQGIGLEIALALAQAGVRVGLHGIATREQIDFAREALAKHGCPESRFFPADLRDTTAIAVMMDAVQDWGGADILVNNAGIQKTVCFSDISADLWENMLAINLSAPFHTMQRALPSMASRGYGRVINIASVQGLIGSVHKAPYVTTKHGLIGLSKVAALEYARAGTAVSGGVTVNCICPGWTRTSIISPQIEERAKQLGCSEDSAIADLLKQKQPSQRLSEPSEIASLALWLCAPAAHNVTGTAIPIDGGWTVQ